MHTYGLTLDFQAIHVTLAHYDGDAVADHVMNRRWTFLDSLSRPFRRRGRTRTGRRKPVETPGGYQCHDALDPASGLLRRGGRRGIDLRAVEDGLGEQDTCCIRHE